MFMYKCKSDNYIIQLYGLALISFAALGLFIFNKKKEKKRGVTFLQIKILKNKYQKSWKKRSITQDCSTHKMSSTALYWGPEVLLFSSLQKRKIGNIK